MIEQEDARLVNVKYVGSGNQHAEHDTVARLADLAALLADAGVAMDRSERGLAQLLGLYHFLDVDGDGWITRSDFLVAVTRGIVDPAQPNDGPHLQAESNSKPGQRAKLVRSLGSGSGSQGGEAKRVDATTTGKALRDEAGVAAEAIS